MRFLVPALLLTACADEELPRAELAETDLVVEGTLPEGTDLDEVREALDGRGFAVLGDPATGELATVTAATAEGRLASAEFSVSAAATCPDCGDPTCTTSLRTVRIGLSHDTGRPAEEFQVVTAGATNFAGTTTVPATFQVPIGDSVTLDTTGNLPTCAPFAWYFDVYSVAPPLRAFVTSTTVKGNFGAAGNASAADALCAQAASDAGIGGAWQAWVRDDVDGLPQDRFVSRGPWVRLGDGATVAAGLSDLVGDTLSAPILYDENGAAVVGGHAWTGFSTQGFGGTCNNWTSQGSGFLLGGYGLTDQADGTWDQANLDTCLTALHLLCFEQ